MSLALDGNSFVDVPALPQEIKELSPFDTAVASIDERLGIPNHDECITSTREKDVQSLGSSHESDLVRGIAPGHCDQHDSRFFALVVVYNGE